LAWKFPLKKLVIIARKTGLVAQMPVFPGLHDSNASLLPHLLSDRLPFTVVSTGTWVVSMAVGGRKVALDPALIERIKLAYRRAVDDPSQTRDRRTQWARQLVKPFSAVPEARQLFEDLGDSAGLAETLEWLGGVAFRREDWQAARLVLEERLAICRKLGCSRSWLEKVEGRWRREVPTPQEAASSNQAM
jgi:hypothetical protein